MDEVTTAMEASTYFVVSNQFRSLQGQLKLLVIKLLRHLRAGGQTTGRMVERTEKQREKKFNSTRQQWMCFVSVDQTHGAPRE